VSKELFIGKVAAVAGASVQAVRYYERVGLLPPAHRTESGYRVYSPELVERLRFIRRAQAVGFRLEEIREILRMKYAGKSPCNCVRGMLEQKLKDVEDQLRDLAAFRQQLRKTLRGARRLPRLPHRASAICPFIESLSAATRKGSEKR